MRMLGRISSLRLRLVALYVVIFVLLQAIVMLTAGLAGRAMINERFDQHLIGETKTIAGALESLDRGIISQGGARQVSSEAEHLLLSFGAREYFIQLRDVDDRIIWQSQNLRGVVLPLLEGEAAERVSITPVRVTSHEFARILPHGDELDIVTLDVDPVHEIPYTIQVAADRSRTENAWRTTFFVLIAFATISVVIAGIASWLMAGRYLSPLRSIAQQAESFSFKRMDQRVSIPSATDELAELVDIINRMLDRLERDMRTQRQFIANVSHELKTPLTIMLGEARKQLRQMEASPAEGGFAELVAEESRRMFRIVEGFLILADAESGEGHDIAMPVDIEDVVLAAVGAAGPPARKRDVHIVPMVPDDAELAESVVLGDFDLLESMIRNLIQNAVRHSPEGESVVVQVRPSRNDNHVDIVVRDHGPGIPEAHLPRVFELFHQVKPYSNPSGTGGIGLSIAKAVAERHGGAISVANVAEGGCEFRIRLPLNGAGAETRPHRQLARNQDRN